jgi:hypothetical protein
MSFVRLRFALHGAHKSEAVRILRHPPIVRDLNVQSETDTVIGRSRVSSDVAVVAALGLVAMPEILLTSIGTET